MNVNTFLINADEFLKTNSGHDFLCFCIGSSNYDLISIAAKCKYSSFWILEEIIESKDEDYCRSVAENPSATEEILNKLSMMDSYYVREAVATNPNTDGKTLSALSKSEERCVIEKVASNPNTPLKTLKGLVATHIHFNVLSAVAKNPSIDEEIISNLLKKPCLHAALMSNPKIPVKYLVDFSHDKNQKLDVLCAIAGNTRTLEKVLIKLYGIVGTNSDMAKALASNPNTYAGILENLVDDFNSTAVHCEVARNPKAPTRLLERLASSNFHKDVHKCVAENPKTSVEILKKLTNSPYQDVSKIARIKLDAKKKEG